MEPRDCRDETAELAGRNVGRTPSDLEPLSLPRGDNRRVKAAQKALIESRGGPEEVMRNLITTNNDTPVPTEVEAKL